MIDIMMMVRFQFEVVMCFTTPHHNLVLTMIMMICLMHSDQISIHSSHDDNVRPGHSQNVDEGSNILSFNLLAIMSHLLAWKVLGTRAQKRLVHR